MAIEAQNWNVSNISNTNGGAVDSVRKRRQGFAAGIVTTTMSFFGHCNLITMYRDVLYGALWVP